MVSRLAETGKPILSLRTFVRLSPMRLYYLRSASLQALATLRKQHPLPPPPPLPPILRQPTLFLFLQASIRPRPFTSDVFGTSSASKPDPAKAWSVFVTGGHPQEFHFVCARLIIRRPFTSGCRYISLSGSAERSLPHMRIAA